METTVTNGLLFTDDIAILLTACVPHRHRITGLHDT